MIWKLELNEASYNSFYDARALRPIGLSNVQAKVTSANTNKDHFGTITNWSQDTFFLVLDDSASLQGELLVSLTYMGVDFSFNSIVVTRSSQGLGLKIQDEQKRESLNWLDFYDIISDRGITPTKM
jgi:hypothetical protein